MNSTSRLDADSILEAARLGEIELHEITMGTPAGFNETDFYQWKPHRFQGEKGEEKERETEQIDPKFENPVKLEEKQGFRVALAEEIQHILETQKNREWKPLTEIDIEGFLYAGYLERNDFVELSFKIANYEFHFRGVVEEVSTDGFFVVFRSEIEKITHKEESEEKITQHFYNYCLLTLPVRRFGLREVNFPMEKIDDSNEKPSTIVRAELRNTLKEIENVNRDFLSPEEYEELDRIFQRFNLFWEKHLTSIRCMFLENSKRNLKLKVLKIKQRFAKLFD